MPKVEFLTRQQKRERTVDEIIDICHVLLLM
jgi:hypothetical protein